MRQKPGSRRCASAARSSTKASAPAPPSELSLYQRPDWVYRPADDQFLGEVVINGGGYGHEARDVVLGTVQGIRMIALTHNWKTDRTETSTDSNGNTTTRTVTKHQAPDTKAAIFWLKNRAPDRWSDRTEVDHTITVMEEQATELMAVMDTALDQLGLTAAQRAALPDAVAQALKARGLVPDDERVIDGQIISS